MKVGDLVRWRHTSEKAIGIIVATRTYKRPDHYSNKSTYIHWSDGDSGWFEFEDLEVISESR